MNRLCTCGRPTNAGRTENAGRYKRCLICETAELFARPKRPSPEQLCEERRGYWRAYYAKNRTAMLERNKRNYEKRARALLAGVLAER